MTQRRDAQFGEVDGNERATRRSRIRSAVDNANAYRGEQGDDDQSGADDVRPMEEWGDIVSQRIEDAIRQGLFDNLSGHGQPLDLRRDPFLPEDQQMAVSLLRNNGLAPEWITERTAILSSIDGLRAELQIAVTQARSSMMDAQDEEQEAELNDRWAAWLRKWQRRLEKLNDRILVHNLKQPVTHLEIYQLRLADELANAGVDSDHV